MKIRVIQGAIATQNQVPLNEGKGSVAKTDESGRVLLFSYW